VNIKVTGQSPRSSFVSGPKFTKLFSSNVGKIVVDKAVLVDCLIRFRDIRDRSVQLSEI